MKKSFEKGGYCIGSFAKYGKKFFVVLVNLYVFKTILTTVDMATGKWGKTIKDKYTYDNYIVYDNKFFCIEYGEITIYDLSGAKTKLKDLKAEDLEAEDDYVLEDVYVQCIVDDKIYYLKEKGRKTIRYDKEVDAGIVNLEGTTKIMRCSLDGSGEEELFACSNSMMADLKLDADCLYFEVVDIGYYNLMRIPLYGGKIKVGGYKVGGDYEIADDSVFFIGDEDDHIYRVNKDLAGKPKAVAKTNYYQCGIGGSARANPFYYGGGHLLVPHYVKKDLKYLALMNEYDDDSWEIYIDATATYAPDWYWMTKKGKVKSIIKGTGVKKKWKEEYKKWH